MRAQRNCLECVNTVKACSRMITWWRSGRMPSLSCLLRDVKRQRVQGFWDHYPLICQGTYAKWHQVSQFGSYKGLWLAWIDHRRSAKGIHLFWCYLDECQVGLDVILNQKRWNTGNNEKKRLYRVNVTVGHKRPCRGSLWQMYLDCNMNQVAVLESDGIASKNVIRA